MTHAELVRLAQNWLRRSLRHGPVLSEIGSAGYENPDVIGWKGWGRSSLIECKVTRSDLLADAKKPFRRFPERGMGRERWYAFPDEYAQGVAWYGQDRGPLSSCVLPIPAKWGIVLFKRSGRARVVRRPDPFVEYNVRSEAVLLVSACRRATEGWGRRVFGDAAPPLVDGDPHPTTAAVIRELRAEVRSLRENVASFRRERDALERKLPGKIDAIPTTIVPPEDGCPYCTDREYCSRHRR